MDYKEMRYELSSFKKEKDILGISFKQLTQEDLDLCWTIYQEVFDHGDTKFYENQTREEKRLFFENNLGLPDAIEHEASLLVLYNKKPIGFSLGIDYKKRNFHISCMCILSPYQNKGIGRRLLSQIAEINQKRDYLTLTLGTEASMKAYYLYKNFGFITL